MVSHPLRSWRICSRLDAIALTRLREVLAHTMFARLNGSISRFTKLHRATLFFYFLKLDMPYGAGIAFVTFPRE
jgi:hypothetical protein